MLSSSNLNNLLVIKADLDGDIRRFSLDPEKLSLENVSNTVYQIFQLDSKSVQLQFYVAEANGGKTYLSSNDILQQVVKNNPNTLRITIQRGGVPFKNEAESIGVAKPIDISAPEKKNPVQQPAELPKQPIPVLPPVSSPQREIANTPDKPNNVIKSVNSSPSISPSTSTSIPSPLASPTIANNNSNSNSISINNEAVQQILSNPLFQQKVKETVSRTLFSPPFLNLLTQALLPSLQASIDESVKKHVQTTLSAATSNNSTLINNNNNNSNNSNNTNNSNNNNIQAEELPVTVNNPIPSLVQKEQEKEKAVFGQPTIAELPPNKESSVGVEEPDEEPEAFVIVNNEGNSVNNGNVNSNSESPKALVQTILDFISGKKSILPLKRSDTNEDGEKPMSIPNLEEILNQLADMGFTDKETNLKVLQFHKNFNEGLAEVVEDLLIQSNTNENKQPAKE